MHNFSSQCVIAHYAFAEAIISSTIIKVVEGAAMKIKVTNIKFTFCNIYYKWLAEVIKVEDGTNGDKEDTDYQYASDNEDEEENDKIDSNRPK